MNVFERIMGVTGDGASGNNAPSGMLPYYMCRIQENILLIVCQGETEAMPRVGVPLLGSKYIDRMSSSGELLLVSIYFFTVA